MEFVNRTGAGRVLAERVRPYAGERPIILALPRGGVPVAAEIAAALGAPLGIVGVRKLGAYRHPEFAVGAIAEGGVLVVDDRAVHAARMDQAQLDHTIAAEQRELERRLRRYRGTPPPSVEGRTAIIVDDGLATGLTAVAAARSVRALGPARLVVAAPVASEEAVRTLEAEADDVVCVLVPEHFEAVGRWYRDFGQTTDEQVVALLAGQRVPRVARARPRLRRLPAVRLRLTASAAGSWRERERGHVERPRIGAVDGVTRSQQSAIVVLLGAPHHRQATPPGQRCRHRALRPATMCRRGSCLGTATAR